MRQCVLIRSFRSLSSKIARSRVLKGAMQCAFSQR
jgi:hypothetical protein